VQAISIYTSQNGLFSRLCRPMGGDGTALAGQICPLNLAKGCALSGSRLEAEPQKREKSRTERQIPRRTSGGTAAKN